MVYKLEIWNKAKIEIIEGYFWYVSKKSNLGFEFIEEVEEMFEYINKYPEHYQIKYKERYREAVLKRFPYLIIYEIIQQTMVVYAVFPTKDYPNKKPT